MQWSDNAVSVEDDRPKESQATPQAEPQMTFAEMLEQHRADASFDDLEAYIREAEEELADQVIAEMRRANDDF